MRVFGIQKLRDYLSSTTNIIKYKNDYYYFYRHLALIMHNFSIDKLKNIFNTPLFQFLEDNKEDNQKTIYRIFEDKYDYMTNKAIKYKHGYARLYIISLGGINYKKKYLYAKLVKYYSNCGNMINV